MRLTLSARPCMVTSVAPASSTALRAICVEVTTWRPISAIEEDNSSVPADTVCRWPRSPRRRRPPRSPAHWIGRRSPTCLARWPAWNWWISAGRPARCGRLPRIRQSGSPCGRRVRPCQCVSVLIGGERAGLDHALCASSPWCPSAGRTSRNSHYVSSAHLHWRLREILHGNRAVEAADPNCHPSRLTASQAGLD